VTTLETKYGALHGVNNSVFYENGSLLKCTLAEPNEISTLYGNYIPQYEDDRERRKRAKSLSFYKNGSLESICLQQQQTIQTSVGVIPAEKLTFYESGKLKRVFPLDGKISGFWGEEDEYALATELELATPFGPLTKKLITAFFYEDGAIKSFTFWPEDSITVPTPLGTIEAQVGVSFYNNGDLHSLEPRSPTLVATPIGEIRAFNTGITGLHGDSNSLSFYQDGRIKALLTATDHIIIADKQGNQIIQKPGQQPSLCSDSATEIVPLLVEFQADEVRFNGKRDSEYSLEGNIFTIDYYPAVIQVGGMGD
jgi:antitoxin component YwqK of YwqJK toxin-antitoxin module